MARFYGLALLSAAAAQNAYPGLFALSNGYNLLRGSPASGGADPGWASRALFDPACDDCWAGGTTFSGFDVPAGIYASSSAFCTYNATSVTIGTDGTVSVTLPGSATASQVGQLQLASFVNPQGLQPLGGNLYASTTSSGTAVNGAPQSNGLGSVNQSYLEASNVDVVQSMVNMISAERAYQLGTQAASAIDNQLNYLAQAAAGA